MFLSIQASQGNPPLVSMTKILAKAGEFTPLLIHASAADCEATAANHNPAIVRCIVAHNKAYEEASGRKLSSYDIRSQAKLAFREALPPLIGRNNIRNFIACVTYGMAIELISSGDAIRLLTAARVASAVQDQRSHHKARKNTPQSAPKARKSAPLSPENPPEVVENKGDTPEN